MKTFIFLIILIFIINNGLANEKNYYLSLKNNKVNVRYGPGFDYPIKYIYKKIFLPVEVIDKKENFRRIVDFKKNSGWIHISQLKKSNSLIVLEDKTLFKLEKGRLVILKKCIYDWCKIKADNYTGWLNTKNSWGKIE